MRSKKFILAACLLPQKDGPPLICNNNISEIGYNKENIDAKIYGKNY